MTTYNVIEAATKLAVPKVIFASSETTYAICFADGELKLDFVPIDESHPTVPLDSYTISKVCNEMTARSFQARTGADIDGLRINNVFEPHEYTEMFNVANDDTSVGITSDQVIQQFYQGVEVRGEMDTYETFYSNK